MTLTEKWQTKKHNLLRWTEQSIGASKEGLCSEACREIKHGSGSQTLKSIHGNKNDFGGNNELNKTKPRECFSVVWESRELSWSLRMRSDFRRWGASKRTFRGDTGSRECRASRGTSHLWEQESGGEAPGRMVRDSRASGVMGIQKTHLARSRGLEWRARNDVDQPGASHNGKPWKACRRNVEIFVREAVGCDRMMSLRYKPEKSLEGICRKDMSTSVFLWHDKYQ